MQFKPRLTSLLASPCVATTLPSRVATITEQPVPQKRQGALFHSNLVCSELVIRLLALVGSANPATLAAAIAAFAFIKSRLFIFILHLLQALHFGDTPWWPSTHREWH